MIEISLLLRGSMVILSRGELQENCGFVCLPNNRSLCCKNTCNHNALSNHGNTWHIYCESFRKRNVLVKFLPSLLTLCSVCVRVCVCVCDFHVHVLFPFSLQTISVGIQGLQFVEEVIDRFGRRKIQLMERRTGLVSDN